MREGSWGRGRVLSRKKKEMKKVPLDISHLVNVHSLPNFSQQHRFFFFLGKGGKACFLLYAPCSLRP